MNYIYMVNVQKNPQCGMTSPLQWIYQIDSFDWENHIVLFFDRNKQTVFVLHISHLKQTAVALVLWVWQIQSWALLHVHFTNVVLAFVRAFHQSCSWFCSCISPSNKFIVPLFYILYTNHVWHSSGSTYVCIYTNMYVYICIYISVHIYILMHVQVDPLRLVDMVFREFSASYTLWVHRFRTIP